MPNDAWAQGRCVPQAGEFISEPFRRRASAYGYVRIDNSRLASLWSGRPDHWTAYA